jgi:hypothetical protein
MEEPSPRTSRRTLAGALAAALALAGGGFLLGRGTGPVPEAEPSNPDEAAQPIFPAWSGPLLRQDLVDLAALAADTTASGMAPDEDLVQSEGQRFEIRLPFGCGGPALNPPRADGLLTRVTGRYESLSPRRPGVPATGAFQRMAARKPSKASGSIAPGLRAKPALPPLGMSRLKILSGTKKRQATKYRRNPMSPETARASRCRAPWQSGRFIPWKVSAAAEAAVSHSAR